MKKIVVMMALVCVVCAGAFAQTVPQGLEYAIEGQSVTITAYNGSAATLVIPGEIEGMAVTGIGDYAFATCSRLKSITIPNSVTEIGDSAFKYCVRLTDITIPASVITIGDSVFEGCTRLTAINVDAANRAYSSDTGVLYDKNKTILIRYPIGKAGTLTIPSSVTSIRDWAFDGCSKLKSVIIPNGVTSIGESAFYGCTSLTSITIPGSVTGIGDRAFHGCSKLKSVIISNGVTRIGDWAFEDCTSLASITIPNSVTSIGDRAFHGCTRLISVAFEGAIAEDNFGDAFIGNLKYVYLDDGGGRGTYKRKSGSNAASHLWTKQ